jgi:hypothetical protein
MSKAKVVLPLLLGAIIVTKSQDINHSNSLNLSDGYRNHFFSPHKINLLPCSISSSEISQAITSSFFSGRTNGNSSLIR